MIGSEKKSKRILIVDDEENIRLSLARLLHIYNYEIDVAPNGAVAMEKFEQQPYDLVVTDILMPTEDGLTFILELKEFNPAVKIIAISGGGRHKNTSFLKIAEKFGADRVMRKPFSSLEFVDVVEELFADIPV